jgi:hypothetical protein
MEPGDEDLDALDMYRDIVDEVLAGRTEGHKCPVCTEGELDCRFDGTSLRVRCRKCGRSFEAMLA